jgi:CDP-paratose 2-epimerase
LEINTGISPSLSWDTWRPGDQSVFVCNLEKSKAMLDWQSEINVATGLVQLAEWVKKNKPLFDWL